VIPALGIVPGRENQPTGLVASAWKSGLFRKVQCQNPAVLLRPHDPDPQRRYALYGFDGSSRGPRVAFSPDGLHWQYPAQPAEDLHRPLFESSDVVSFFAPRIRTAGPPHGRLATAAGVPWEWRCPGTGWNGKRL